MPTPRNAVALPPRRTDQGKEHNRRPQKKSAAARSRAVLRYGKARGSQDVAGGPSTGSFAGGGSGGNSGHPNIRGYLYLMSPNLDT